jgi:Ca-activated chloride channel family protein
MEGNFYHSRGMTNEAIAAYLKASGHEAVKPYAEFGLGVMYYELDEKKAALERFSDAEKAVENKAGYDELLYRIHYNTGIVRFENGQYDEAARAFRQALWANANHVEAKRNLELSLLSREREGSNLEGGLGAGEKKQETETLFDYLRDKESKQWKSREWIDDTPSSGPDY